ncbi:MAG: sigma-54 dependent transcriptional regulator [Deltaproteobacteria bacterium]|nr:sigma-54 dependent transcriptional regulator [Deltaproteobacteria bacterium]
MEKHNVLIVDDNKDMCWILEDMLARERCGVITANDGVSGVREFEKHRPDLVLLDLRLPGMGGMEVLDRLKNADPELKVIILSAYGDIKGAVRAIKLGAYDFITKPFRNEELLNLVRKALSTPKSAAVRRAHGGGPLFAEGVKGEAASMKKVMEQINLIAPTNMTVVLQGESGTGKELLARMLHRGSPRKDKPFVALDCGALPETLFDSELFGYEKGAFTGAGERKEGHFELAGGGTLFLDEITNLCEPMQMKLLRVIQERKVRHLGGKKDIGVDVRIVAATNLDLSGQVKQGRFRSDLFYRLSEFIVQMPPLRERGTDVLLLADYFIEEANKEFAKSVKGLSDDVRRAFLEYNWPGNIRECKNVIRRAVLLAGTDYIEVSDIADIFAPGSLVQGAGHGECKNGSFHEMTRELTKNAERELIKKALAEANNNKTRAAKLLKIDRVTLYSKLKALGLD